MPHISIYFSKEHWKLLRTLKKGKRSQYIRNAINAWRTGKKELKKNGR